MSLQDAESSSYGSDPTQLFLFRMGGRRWGYIGQDVSPVFFLGIDFIPDTNVALGQFAQSGADVAGDIDITISAQSEVAMMFVPYLPPEPLHVTVYRSMPDAAPGEYAVEVDAEIISSTFDESEGTCVLTARLLSKELDREVPWCIYSGMCNYAVYGAGCGVPREEYMTETTIVTGAGTDLLGSPDFATAGLGNAAPEQWFRMGFVVHVPTNEIRFIIGHDTNSPDIKIQTPFLSLKNGDLVRAYPGCNRLRSHCGPRFNNKHRLLGFPWMPDKNPYTQSVYGNNGANIRPGEQTKAILKAYGKKGD